MCKRKHTDSDVSFLEKNTLSSPHFLFGNTHLISVTLDMSDDYYDNDGVGNDQEEDLHPDNFDYDDGNDGNDDDDIEPEDVADLDDEDLSKLEIDKTEVEVTSDDLNELEIPDDDEALDVDSDEVDDDLPGDSQIDKSENESSCDAEIEQVHSSTDMSSDVAGSIDDPESEGNLDTIFGDMMDIFQPGKIKKFSKEERTRKLAQWYRRSMGRKNQGRTILPTDAVKGKYTKFLGDTIQQVETSIRSVLKANITTYGWTRMQVESFNKFYSTDMAEIVNECPPSLIDSRKHPRRVVVEFSNPKWGAPCLKEFDGTYRQITPEECLQRGLSWTAPVFADTTHHTFETESPPGAPSDTPLTAPVPPELTPAELEKLSPSERLAVYGKLIETRVYRETLIGFIPMMRGSLGDPTRFNSPSANGECPTSSKGSFVITGMEKVVVPQENPRINYCRVTQIRKQQQRFSHRFECRALHESRIRSSSTIKGYVLKGSNPKMFIAMPFIQKFLIPMTVVFRLVGITTPDQMLECILGKDKQSDAFINMAKCMVEPDDHISKMNLAQLLDWIGSKGTKETLPLKRARYVKHIFANEFFPQMGLKKTLGTIKKRAEYFGYCIRKTIRLLLGGVEEDDIDHDMDKAWDTVGVLNSILFRQLFRAFVRSLTVSIHLDTEKGKYINVVDSMVTKRITGGFRYFYTTGNFGISRGGNTQKGVCQVLTGFNMWCKLNHLRRINKPINREGKATAPRMLHASSWGHKCPVATPEGESCGLVLAAALLVHVRVGYKSLFIKSILLQLGVIPLLDQDGNLNLPPPDSVRVMINYGKLYGYHSNPKELRSQLLEYRRANHIYFDTTIAYLDHLKETEFHIAVEAGCMLRPLFVVENLHKFPALYAQYGHNLGTFWNQLMVHGVIEYISSLEESTCLVAMFPDDVTCYHSHLEISPCTVMSVEAYALAMTDSNQAPRNIYASGMIRHNYGAFPAMNYMTSMATAQHILHYPQLPMTTTDCEDLITPEQQANVQNAVVAISVDVEGLEDSVIMNRRFVDFGGGRCTVLKTYRDQEKITGADLETFTTSDKTLTKGLQDGNYSKIDQDGIMAPGTSVGYKDILCNKVQHSNQTNAKKIDTVPSILGTSISATTASSSASTAVPGHAFVKMVDKAMMYKSRESGVIDRVTVSTTEEGCKQVRIRVRTTRIPEPGDKVAMRGCAQKGVIGVLRNPEDMMFNPETGMSPDIVFNLSGVISRMTMSFLKEALFGKLGCLEGKRINGTNYRPDSLEEIELLMQSHGMQSCGKETMIDGETGKLMEVSIFTGVVGYMRMKQMVVDKEHARPHGPKSSITRQPKEGRRQNGGIRFGEMEKDNMIDHGAPATLDDRINKQSDSFRCFIHRDCGLLCEAPKSKVNKLQNTLTIVRNSLADTDISSSSNRDPNRPWCRACLSSDNCFIIHLPYACKLLFQELKAVHIQPRILVEPDGGVEVTYEQPDHEHKFSNQQLIDMCHKQLPTASQKRHCAHAEVDVQPKSKKIKTDI